MNMMSASTLKCLMENYCIIYSTEIGKLDMPQMLKSETDIFQHLEASLVTQMVKYLPAMQETWFQPVVWEGPLEEGMATHSSILAWRIPLDRETGGPRSKGSQRVRHN